MIQKHKPIRSQKLRDSAKDEECTLQIAGCCNHDTSTTVLAHLPFETHGMGQKACDVSACFACSDCHSLIDGRTSSTSDFVIVRDWYMRRAMVRTWRRWIELGLVKIA